MQSNVTSLWAATPDSPLDPTHNFRPNFIPKLLCLSAARGSFPNIERLVSKVDNRRFRPARYLARNRIVHINPDHFLQTESGRIVTPDRNIAAWAKCFESLNEALQNASPSTKVYVLIGPQGCGKRTWARVRNSSPENPIVFDAILVKRAEREPILAAAGTHSIQAIAVWFKTPLEVCISRNALRPTDEVVPEQAIRNVHRAIEPPSIAEGFAQVIEVPYVPGA